jgi:SAM-dependent methyltransferase
MKTMSKYSQNMPPDLKAAIGWMYDSIESDKVFLDFGCSTGYFGQQIKQGKQCAVYGVEISADAEEARRVLDGVYSFDLDGAWPEAIYERKYDYLFFGDVLEHLKDPGEVLKKCKKLLRNKDSRIFVSIPNIAHISIRLELLLGDFEYEPMGILDNTHLKYFTLPYFSRVANTAGYSVQKVDYTVNDYPKTIINKFLSKAGLRADDKFWKIVASKEARAYQYKFVLKPEQKAEIQKILPTLPLPTIPDQQREEYLEDLRTQARVLHEHSKKQAEIIEHYVTLHNDIKAENELLRSNLRTVRLAKRTVEKYLKRTKK